jgi:autotransporter-associated beta strand protein
MTGHSKATFENTAVQQFQGWLQLGDLGGTAIVNLSDFASFELTKSSVGIGSSAGATGRIILNDSAAFSSKGFVFVGLGTATEASITLNGGTFTAPQFVTEGPGQIKFNGGVLQASAASDDYIAGASFALNVDAGGAKIDTNGFDIAIAREFHNISTTTPGGLTKLGDGKLTLTAALTGLGDTTVNRGELNAAAGINTPSDTVYVATGATWTAPTIVADTLTIGGLPKGAAVAVPEPGTLALLAMAGLISVWFAIRRKR